MKENISTRFLESEEQRKENVNWIIGERREEKRKATKRKLGATTVRKGRAR